MNTINFKKSALLIIDVQNDFCPGGSLAVSGGSEVVPAINSLSPLFPAVIATKDWHPADHVSFASNHPGKSPMETVTAEKIEQILWPDHCIQNTPGAELHADLDLAPVDMVLHKGTSPSLDSYSAFFENDKKTVTGLCGYLTGLDIRRVFLAGLAEDVCVFASAMDAVSLGFEVFIIADAVRGVDVPGGTLQSARKTMAEAGIAYRNSADLTGA